LKKNGDYKVSENGDLILHGIKRFRELPAVIRVKDGQYSLTSVFQVPLEDHKIQVPTVMFNKIAETIKVDVTASLKPIETNTK
jgi:hypothetical protein